MPPSEETIAIGGVDVVDVHAMSQIGGPVDKVSAMVEVTEHQLPETLLDDSPAESSWDKMSSGNQSAQADVPIAICGMAMRLPGGISSEGDFWDFLINKKDARCRIPAERYNIDAFHSNTTKSGAIKTTHGYFLDHVDLAHFDASFFSMTKSELEKLDPQHRLLLEVTRECLENAGEMNWRGKDIGCYIGVFGEDWLDLHAKDTQDSGMYRITGYGDFLLGNRVSYEYDFKGPSVTVKTGCSSSLICLHMACEALKAREISSAIVGGSNLIMGPTMTQAMFEQGVLSPTGSCRTFDADANGYARGEAINAVYVKRLDDALSNGDPIRAVIRATASNCDGKTPGIAHPSSESHEALIRSCYESAGLYDFTQTGFVECHGTGTATGDPLEATAVANVFGEKGVYIGSVKPNLGHSEGASGLTSVIKSVLALENKTIPPNIKFTNPNPKIPFKRGGLTVPVDSTPWPEDRVERASVNSFGIGGANAHVILDSADSFAIGKAAQDKQPGAAGQDPKQRLLVFTANNAESVRKGASNLQEYAGKYPEAVDDAAYTLAVRRQHLPYRAFAVANPSATAPLEFVAPSKAPTVAPRVTFVFTGQGAQWPTMGAKLCTEFPSVLEDFKLMDKVLAELETPPSWTIRDELTKPKDISRLDQAEFSQPLCTAVQIAIVNILRTWGVQPAAVVGHSSGEIAAAYCSGALTAAEAITAAYLRGLVTKKQKRAGAMAAVGMGSSAVQGYLVDGVTVACENSPDSTTLSGDEDKMDGVLAKIKEDIPDVFARRLKVEMAYHSYHMKEIGDEYEKLLSPHASSAAPVVPFYSSVSNEIVTKSNILDAAYWRANLESPVLFSTAVEKLLAAQPSDNLFLEIGPHSALAGPLRQIFKANGQSDAAYSPTLVRGQDDATSMLTAAGQLFQKAVSLDFEALNPTGKLVTNLPNYPWHHDTRYWHESRISKEWRLRTFPRHDVLGSQVVECSKLEPIWRNMLRLDDVPWCRDHLIAQDTVFPGAGYIAMAGEAIRQVSGQDDFSLRQVSISSAMILHEGTATETMFALRPLRLTNSLDSSWYEFNVSSFNGTTWTKHCAGQVRAGASTEDTEQLSPKIVDLPRKVQSAHWYSTMRAVGLNYGPRFQGLESISAHPVENRAVAHVSNDFDLEKESTYQLHPTTMDLCIQLFSAAASNGQSRSFGNMSVPTYFGEVYVRAPSSQMTVQVNAEVSAKGAILGDCVAAADNGVVLAMKDVKLSPLDDDGGSADPNPHAGVRLVWKPDVAFTKTADLVSTAKAVRDPYPVVQKLILLCSVEASNRLAGLDTPLPHMTKFSAWLDAQTAAAQALGYPFVDDAAALFALTSEAREALISETAALVQETEAANVGTAVMRIFENIQGIHRGETEPLELLIKDEVLTKLYDFANGWDYKPFLHLLSHSKPHMKVLEIGAGTGATTAVVLSGLVSEFGERMFQSYTYTDISAGFFAAAKERFKDVQGMEYVPLDISRDPAGQGLELGSFDLIIATNVLHATPSLKETLVNVRKLLQPNGKLLLQELCTQAKWINFIMGVLPGWWLGDADARPDEPYVQPDRWTQELEAAGFAGAEAVILDDEMPYTTNATIISSPKNSVETTEEVTKPVSILSRDPEGPVAKDIATALKSHGLEVDFVSLAEAPHKDVISILDLEGPSFVADISEPDYALFKAFATQLTSAKMLWLTRPCQIRSQEPAYAQIIGLARTLRNELSIDFATLELDTVGPRAWDAVAGVLGKYRRQSARKEGDYDPEYEYALSDGAVHIPRFHWTSVLDELADEGGKDDAAAAAEAPRRLEIGKRGSLKTLRWVERPPITLRGDEVAVEIRAVGMNFKDILIAMGVVDGNKAEGNGLGCECSGVVQSVGPEVTDLAVGDRVVVFAGNSYSTILRTSAQLCAKMPDDLSFADGATMPCVYGTVIHGLLDVGGLGAGQSVLIHSACGGIGIAAIQIARMVGAEIFATVGNEEKVQYLVDTFQIPRERIFNSRNTSFLPKLMQATGGKGVDVVLNSLSGELLHASWQCVAQFGKMVEIGKRDFIGQGRLAMDLFEANRSFFGVDLAQICADRPSMIKKLLADCMNFYGRGSIQPIRPTKYFDAVHIEDAFRFMQRGQHIGKIVVRIPENHADLRTAKIQSGFTLRSDASYLLVGGLGGLGRSVSTWMVENGARHLVYLSRSGGKGPHDEALVTELAAAGCEVQIIAGSVADLADVRKVTSQAKLPVAGVIQMSMVLRDGGFPQMTHQDWTDVASPKVRGTWNLHEAFQGQPPLDFFVLFSSFSGLVGQWGQANYASANTFLDAFVQFRHAAGLPASVLDIGAMADVGYVSQNAGVMEQFRATAVHILREQDLLDSLALAVKQSRPSLSSTGGGGRVTDGYLNGSQLGIGLKMTQPIAAPNNRSIWKRDVRMSLYRNLETASDEGAAGQNDELKGFMAAVADNPRMLTEDSSVAILAQQIGSTLFGFMMKPLEELDIKASPSALGMDSLVAIELRNWSRQGLGLEISVLEIMNAPSIERLSQFVAEGLMVKLGLGVRDGETFLLMKAP